MSSKEPWEKQLNIAAKQATELERQNLREVNQFLKEVVKRSYVVRIRYEDTKVELTAPRWTPILHRLSRQLENQKVDVEFIYRSGSCLTYENRSSLFRYLFWTRPSDARYLRLKGGEKAEILNPNNWKAMMTATVHPNFQILLRPARPNLPRETNPERQVQATFHQPPHRERNNQENQEPAPEEAEEYNPTRPSEGVCYPIQNFDLYRPTKKGNAHLDPRAGNPSNQLQTPTRTPLNGRVTGNSGNPITSEHVEEAFASLRNVLSLPWWTAGEEMERPPTPGKGCLF